MAKTSGLFGGFNFDPEVFSDYMSEQSYVKNAIIASGILREDATIQNLIGSKGNVGTLPFYLPIDAEAEGMQALNNDGKTDNVPVETAGGKQTFMVIQRMKAFKDSDFTRELTGANPLQNVATKVSDYYKQVWQRELVNIASTVVGVDGLETHITDISSSSGTYTDSNYVNETSDLDVCQKACGDMADRFSLVIMHSKVYTRLNKLQLIQYNKYTIGGALAESVNLPTWNGRIVIVDDRGTVSSDGLVYTTFFFGEGAFLTAPKDLENPYEVDRDPESKGGINKLYTKQSRVLHPNGFSLAIDKINEESPTYEELGKKENWTLRFNAKNVPIAILKSNG